MDVYQPKFSTEVKPGSTFKIVNPLKVNLGPINALILSIIWLLLLALLRPY